MVGSLFIWKVLCVFQYCGKSEILSNMELFLYSEAFRTFIEVYNVPIFVGLCSIPLLKITLVELILSLAISIEKHFKSLKVSARLHLHCTQSSKNKIKRFIGLLISP